ncbi:hypothetical protein [uncultured Pontibacter sp.]|uniref:hypothetical protein n=1 Tax=uncultured Pontibacter sp. TaxID=453356 RepID=UPI00261DED64|nr:hypothetical protein [uncultured Pontibacter sp.]
MKAPDASYFKPATPLINHNLKLSQKDAVSQVRKRIATLEQAGLADDTYQQLLRERLVPRPLEVKKHKHFNITECVWFVMLKELKSCNYAPEVLWSFMLRLFADIVEEADALISTEEETGNPILSYPNASSTFLELLVAAALVQQKDLVIQFTRDGDIGFLAQVPSSENYALHDQAVISFSVYSILKCIAGPMSLPEIKTQTTLTSPEEKQVLELARAKEWEKIEIKQVTDKQHTNWLLATSKYLVLTKQEFHLFSNKMPSHNRLNNVEYGPKTVKFEYEERLRLKV